MRLINSFLTFSIQMQMPISIEEQNYFVSLNSFLQ
jgi:hypothetical protein